MEMLQSLIDLFASFDLEVVIRLMFQVVLLVMSAFFSGSETAMFSLSRLDLQKLRSMRHPRSETIHEMLDEPRRLIISILCGNELVNIASSANMAAILITFFGEADTTWINILIMVPLLLLVGEVTPKTFAVTYPVKFSTNLTALLLPHWIRFIAPLRDAVRFVADRITTAIVGEPVQQENILHADEFRTLVEESAATGAIVASERILIDNMLEASKTEVADIMTPAPRMVCLDASRPLTKVLEEFRQVQHPRVPLYLNHPGNIIGFLHSEDAINLLRSNKDLDTLRVEDVMRPAHFIPPTKKVDEMVDYFQENRTRAAMVVGEYGGVLGIVSIRDVAGFILGEMVGVKKEAEEVQEDTEGLGVSVPGDMNLTDFNALTGYGIEDPAMNTIGGVAFRYFNRMPGVGDQVEWEGHLFTVEAMDGLRIKTLRVAPLEHEEFTASAPASGTGAGPQGPQEMAPGEGVAPPSNEGSAPPPTAIPDASGGKGEGHEVLASVSAN